MRKKNSEQSAFQRVLNLTYLVCYENGFLLRRAFVNHTNTVRNFNLRDDDIFVLSHPKTGTTWNTGNNFMRKGIVGDWANYFDDQTNKEFQS